MRDGVSEWFCSYPAISHTHCRLVMRETESTGDSAIIWQDHVPTVCQQWERWSQRAVLQLYGKIMYILWIGDRRDGVSWWFCSYPARSCTSCGLAMGETQSAGGSAAIRQDYVHPVGPRWERWCQRVVLQLSDKITYNLWIGNGRDGVNKWFCSYPARSCTSCGSAMEVMESAGGSAAIQQDNIHPVGWQGERQSQLVVL